MYAPAHQTRAARALRGEILSDSDDDEDDENNMMPPSTSSWLHSRDEHPNTPRTTMSGPPTYRRPTGLSMPPMPSQRPSPVPFEPRSPAIAAPPPRQSPRIRSSDHDTVSASPSPFGRAQQHQPFDAPSPPSPSFPSPSPQVRPQKLDTPSPTPHHQYYDELSPSPSLRPQPHDAPKQPAAPSYLRHKPASPSPLRALSVSEKVDLFPSTVSKDYQPETPTPARLWKREPQSVLEQPFLCTVCMKIRPTQQLFLGQRPTFSPKQRLRCIFCVKELTVSPGAALESSRRHGKVNRPACLPRRTLLLVALLVLTYLTLPWLVALLTFFGYDLSASGPSSRQDLLPEEYLDRVEDSKAKFQKSVDRIVVANHVVLCGIDVKLCDLYSNPAEQAFYPGYLRRQDPTRFRPHCPQIPCPRHAAQYHTLRPEIQAVLGTWLTDISKSSMVLEELYQDFRNHLNSSIANQTSLVSDIRNILLHPPWAWNARVVTLFEYRNCEPFRKGQGEASRIAQLCKFSQPAWRFYIHLRRTLARYLFLPALQHEDYQAKLVQLRAAIQAEAVDTKGLVDTFGYHHLACWDLLDLPASLAQLHPTSNADFYAWKESLNTACRVKGEKEKADALDLIEIKHEMAAIVAMSIERFPPLKVGGKYAKAR